MNRLIYLCAAAIVSPHALADVASIQKCRALKDAVPRLACYDAIDLGKPAAAAPVAPSAARAAGSAASAVAPAAAEFGLAPRQTAVGVDRIETTIKGRLDSWQQGSRIRLANGQLWQVSDDSRGVCDCDNRKVVVTRGAFGTYFLEIEGKGNAPRVKRLE